MNRISGTSLFLVRDIERLAPTFVQFYRHTADHVHGLSTRTEM